LFIILILVIIIYGECTPYTVTVPDGFVELQNEHFYNFRAVSANNSVLAIKYVSNKEKGDLAFWYKVITNFIILKKAYKFVKEDKYTCTNGVEGKAALYETVFRGEKTKYFMTLFVTKSNVIIIEFTADEKYWDNEFKNIEKFIKDMTIT